MYMFYTTYINLTEHRHSIHSYQFVQNVCVIWYFGFMFGLLLIIKVKAIRSPETLVDIYRTIYGVTSPIERNPFIIIFVPPGTCAATLHTWKPSPPYGTWGRAMSQWQGIHSTWHGRKMEQLSPLPQFYTNHRKNMFSEIWEVSDYRALHHTSA
jgi:hypothetical protein